MKIQFIKSASQLSECPVSEKPEVAVIGRSNAGKSSLLNKMVGSGVAKVSQTPGKTGLLNFFMVDNLFYLVDLPGYGYASRSKQERQGWTSMIEGYLAGRPGLRGVILVIDGQRQWDEDEDNLLDWLDNYGCPTALAVNKMDRFNQKETVRVQRRFSAISGLQSVHFVSAKTGRGVSGLFRSVFENMLRP